MTSAAVDVKELPAAYVFVADMPGLKNTDVKVWLTKHYCNPKTHSPAQG